MGVLSKNNLQKNGVIIQNCVRIQILSKYFLISKPRRFLKRKHTEYSRVLKIYLLLLGKYKYRNLDKLIIFGEEERGINDGRLPCRLGRREGEAKVHQNNVIFSLLFVTLEC